MVEASGLPSWDLFVLVAPILGLLGMLMFGVDEQCASLRERRAARRSFCEVGGTGPATLSDPDGRVWHGGRAVQIEARLIRGVRPDEREGGGPGRPPLPRYFSKISGYVIDPE